MVEQVALRAGAVQRADGIEHVDHAQRKRGSDEHHGERAAVVTGDTQILREVKALIEHRAGRIFAPCRKRIERIGDFDTTEQICRIANTCRVRDARKPVIQHRRTEDAPQHRALHLLFGEDRDGEYAQNRNDRREHAAHRTIVIGEEFVCAEDIEGDKGRQRAFVIDDDARLLHADEGDEQSDADGDRVAHARGDRLEDLAAQPRRRQDQEDNAVQKRKDHAVRIGQPRPA